MADEVPQWSDETISKNFRIELRRRFEAHNAKYRAHEAAELEQVLREHPEKRGQPGYEVRDSFAWEIYSRADIRVDRNTVTIVMPIGVAFRPDILPLFDHTAMAWSRPIIGAMIVDGEPRPTIEITLVATWTDEMDAKWRAEGNARKQVEVELYEVEVHALVALVAQHCVPNGATSALLNRLKLALEPIP